MHKYLLKRDVHFLTFAYNWILTLFVKEFERVKVSVLIWDKFLACGADMSHFHVAMAVSILTVFEERLKKMENARRMLGFLRRLEPLSEWNASKIDEFISMSCKLALDYNLVNGKPWFNVEMPKKRKV